MSDLPVRSRQNSKSCQKQHPVKETQDSYSQLHLYTVILSDTSISTALIYLLSFFGFFFSPGCWSNSRWLSLTLPTLTLVPKTSCAKVPSLLELFLLLTAPKSQTTGSFSSFIVGVKTNHGSVWSSRSKPENHKLLWDIQSKDNYEVLSICF